MRFVQVAILVVFVFAAGVAAQDYKQLKEEIQTRQKAVTEAVKERDAADKALNDNRAAQAKAEGNQLAALKREARTLARVAGEKADALSDAERKLADKQGELRSTAAAHAVKQLSASGKVDDRVGEANNAVDDWKSALGKLPAVPAMRSLEGIVDPDERAAIRRQDKKSLEDYDKWAATEEARVNKEIGQADELLKGKDKFKQAADGGQILVEAVQAMKKTLESRKDALSRLRKTAQDRIKSIR